VKASAVEPAKPGDNVQTPPGLRTRATLRAFPLNDGSGKADLTVARESRLFAVFLHTDDGGPVPAGEFLALHVASHSSNLYENPAAVSQGYCPEKDLNAPGKTPLSRGLSDVWQIGRKSGSPRRNLTVCGAEWIKDDQNNASRAAV